MNRLSILLLAAAAACASEPTSPIPGGEALAARAVSDPTAVFSFPIDASGLNLISDGLYSDGTSSRYANGECGVTARIYLNGTGDATMQTDNPSTGAKKCAAYPRKMTLSYDDGFVETIPLSMNLNELQTGSFRIPVGATAKRAFAINPISTTRCDILVWSAERKGVLHPADSVLVTRTSATTWRVETQPYPNNRAHCTTTGTVHYMSVRFVITSSASLP